MIRQFVIAALGACSVALAACRSEPADPQQLLTAHSAGVTFLQRGQLAEAEREFRKVVDMAPRDPLGHANLGLTYLQSERFEEAEDELERARRLDENNVEVGLMLARLHAVTNRADEARELLESLPPDARVYYALAQLDGEASRVDTAALRRYEGRLRQTLSASPGNIAVRLQLADVMIRRQSPDSAAVHLEEYRRLRPAPAAEVMPFLNTTINELRAGRVPQARPAFDRFMELVEVTAPYQAALEEVKWVEGTLAGRPILTFNPQSLITTGSLARLGAADVRFVDVTDEAGLGIAGPTAMAIGDHDGDSRENLYVSARLGAGAGDTARFFSLQGGFAAEISQRFGSSLPRRAAHASFADYDNDGWLDLFAIDADGAPRMLRNDRDGGFRDASAETRIPSLRGASGALFADLDHDGDLDILVIGAPTRLFRNNLDGSFTEVANAGGMRGSGVSRDAVFGDFDGDGRTDVFVAHAAGGDALYRNAGFQDFSNVAASSGIASSGSSTVALGDYDNNGTLDLLTAAADGTEPVLWRNTGRGAFQRDRRSDAGFAALGQRGVLSMRFFDYDNDGWLDVVAGTRGGLALYHNDGTGRFQDASSRLPRMAGAARLVVPMDADTDGDPDLLVADSGTLRLLRNDGGNVHLAMQVQLVGLRTGSGKNNTFGIGSRVEVRAGELYQTRVVTDRTTHIGLGSHLKADVVRVRWTNGVPQTIYFPGTDQDVLELEQLKGSCAFLYTWDGKRFRFVTDVMWRSALGMPLGIMGGGKGGTSAWAPAGASQEYLRIPGEALQQRDGRYVIQITEELWETAYLDELRLIAVDHPDSVDVFVDERFVPPAPITLRMFKATHRYPPLSAVNERGEDVLPAIRAKDDVYVADLRPLQYQGLVEQHDLVLDLGPNAGAPRSHLFLRGWIYPTDASINVSLAQRSDVGAVMPSLEVRNARGQWQTATANIGFPSGKDKTIVIDLAGKFPTSDHRVRIRTNMQIYWDHAFVATDAPVAEVRTTELNRIRADLHFRGFSRMFRRGSRFGPHWFDYDSVTAESPWSVIEGRFTRFGDVRQLLDAQDDMYVVMGPGDETTIEFDARTAQPLPQGWKRTFLLYTDGWIKDADLNTAFGNVVEPLPFHAQRSYPNLSGESYPADSTHERYRREYQTRALRR